MGVGYRAKGVANRVLSLPGKVYSKVRERRVQPILKPQVEEEQCGRGTTDQLFTLSRILEGTWEYAHPVYMYFVYLEKVHDQVPREKFWEVLREYGVRGHSSWPSNLCTPKARAVSAFLAESQASLGLRFVTNPV